MGGQHEDDFTIPDVDIGVVPFIFGNLRDFIQEVHGFGKTVELNGADDFFAIDLPFRSAFEEALEIFFG